MDIALRKRTCKNIPCGSHKHKKTPPLRAFVPLKGENGGLRG